MFRARSGITALLQAQAAAVSRCQAHPESISSLACLALSSTSAARHLGNPLGPCREARTQTESSTWGQQRRQLFSFPGGDSAKPKEYHERKLLQ